MALMLLFVFGVVVAVVARLRLWYYDRRDQQQVAIENATTMRLNLLRDECNELWWEGQL